MEFHVGQNVLTVKPEREAGDWSEAAKASRRWDAFGVITDYHNSHGLVYVVEHKDGSTGYYEEHELNDAYFVRMNDADGNHIITARLTEQGRAKRGCHEELSLWSGDFDLILDVRAIEKCKF